MPNGQTCHIMYVDDDQFVRKMVAGMLAVLGYDCMVAKDGPDALDAFHANSFELVLTDISMPLMDGWELARRLKEINPAIPIVAVTGENPQDILARLPGSPISYALFKPFSQTGLRDALNEVFERSHPPNRRQAQA
jgi:CheY-like chemotaxis protein